MVCIKNSIHFTICQGFLTYLEEKVEEEEVDFRLSKNANLPDNNKLLALSMQSNPNEMKYKCEVKNYLKVRMKATNVIAKPLKEQQELELCRKFALNV